MNFAKNLQILRKMLNMTQEELAEKMKISRQTVSKWELGVILPEVEKLLELGRLFHCSVDSLLQDNMELNSEAYSDIRITVIDSFRYFSHAVISSDPETDASTYAENWANYIGIEKPRIIGWDFPHVSQEQQNVFHMHGYEAALVLPDGSDAHIPEAALRRQEKQRYITITLKEQIGTEFTSIPNAYKALLTHMAVNGIKEKHDAAVLSCFEHEYFDEKGEKYMDIFIAIE